MPLLLWLRWTFPPFLPRQWLHLALAKSLVQYRSKKCVQELECIHMATVSPLIVNFDGKMGVLTQASRSVAFPLSSRYFASSCSRYHVSSWLLWQLHKDNLLDVTYTLFVLGSSVKLSRNFLESGSLPI